MVRGLSIQLNEPSAATYLKELYFKIYDESDNLLHTTGSHNTDSNVTVTDTTVYLANIDVGDKVQFKVSCHLSTSDSEKSDISKLYLFRADLAYHSYINLLEDFQLEDGDYIEIKCTMSNVNDGGNQFFTFYPYNKVYQYNNNLIRFLVKDGSVNLTSWSNFVPDQFYVIRLDRVSMNECGITVDGVRKTITSSDDLFARPFRHIGANAPGTSGAAGTSPAYWLNGEIEYVDFNGSKMYIQQFDNVQYDASETIGVQLLSASGAPLTDLLS